LFPPASIALLQFADTAPSHPASAARAVEPEVDPK